MHWYHYFAALLSGMLLTNFVPHFVKGTCGDKFPTPFANPRGIGLSSSTVNVVWALFNLAAGYILFRLARISQQDTLSLLVFFVGISILSIFGSIRFQKKHTT